MNTYLFVLFQLENQALYTSDRPDAETSTWQHITLTRDISILPLGLEPAIPASECADPRLRPRVHWNRRYKPVRLRFKCDSTRAVTRFRLSAKRTSPFKSAGASVLSTAGSRGVRNSGSNAGYTMLQSSVKSTGHPLYSPVFPSLPLPCVTVCHHISIEIYLPKIIRLLSQFT
jgi:hypothetical protein